MLWLCAVSAALQAQHCGPIYVRHDATGAQTGTSWANAFRSLQDAIDAAPPGGQIWIAAGVYKPERDSTGNASPANIRARTFFISKGLQLYGGFSGTEQSLEQRNFSTNPTVLSGDLGTPDLQSDNAYHVVQLERTGSMCILDGLVITRGNANDTTGNTNKGGGILLQHAPSQYSVLTLRNCIIEQNNATYGGGLYSITDSWNGPPILIERCQFRNNTASWGGGIYFGQSTTLHTALRMIEVNFISQNVQQHGGGLHAWGRFIAQNCHFESNRANRGAGVNVEGGTATIENCIFQSNSSQRNGGGMRAEASTAILTNCLFVGNEANIFNEFFTTTNAGGGFFYRGSSSTSAILTNCVFSGNKGQRGAGFAITTTLLSSSFAKLDNCSFAGNSGQSVIDRIQGTLAVNNSIVYGNIGVPLINSSAQQCIIEGGYAGTGNIDANPLFISHPNPASAPATQGDLRLRPNSPAINTGNSSLAPSNSTTDAGGNRRVIDCIIDRGAFEFGSPGAGDIICYADNDGDGAGNPAAPRLACNSCPVGFVANHNDCNDSNSGITNTLPAPTASKPTTFFCRGESSANLRSISAQAPGRLVWVLVQAPAGSRFAGNLPHTFMPGEVNQEFSIGTDTLTMCSEPAYLGQPVNGVWRFEVYYETTYGCRSAIRQGFSVQVSHEQANGRIVASHTRACAGQPIVLSFEALTGQAPFRVVVNGRTYSGLSNGMPFDTLLAGVDFSDSLVLRLEQVADTFSCPGTAGALQTLTLYNAGVQTFTTLTVSACDSYTLNGQTYTQSGNYTQVLTNSAGCDSIVMLQLTINPSPVIALQVQHPACPDSGNGQVEAIAQQGVGPFTYLWSNGQTTPTATGLNPGTYILTLADAIGCSSTQSVTLTAQYEMNIAITTLQTVVCHGESTGAVAVEPLGGIGPYQVQWAHGPQTATLAGLPAGVYRVSITDANGCVASGKVVFTQPQPLNLNVHLNGITLTAQQPNVSYQWIDCAAGIPIPGATQQSFTPSQNGRYAVVLTQDACRDTSECVLVSVTSLAQASGSLNLPMVFPNPNNGQFTLRLPWPAEVFLYDLSGRMLSQSRYGQGEYFVRIDVPAGAYLLRIAHAHGVHTMRIIINRT